VKLIKLVFIYTLIIQTISAQKSTINDFSTIDKKALQIADSLTNSTEDIAGYFKANFFTDEEKCRAIFVWVCSNIKYDIDNMFAINFYEKKEEKIVKPLRTRKGICENYASLFTDICLKSGIKSFVIEGYTKQNGFTDYIPHAWSASLINNTWFLFDPTWGSGYLKGGKFFKKINNEYFKVNPKKLIKSHIPFDYLWQFLNYPITNQEFHEGKIHQNKTKAYFNYNDSIKLYENQNHINQLISSSYRVKNNGVKNSLVFNRLQYLKLEIENYKQTKNVNFYNAAIVDYNQVIEILNSFISYRNNQFIPKKTDAEIQDLIDDADNKLKDSKSKLGQILNSDENATLMINQLSKSIEVVSTQISEQQNWLKLYFSKSKLGRKSMFYKVSLFGNK
jgi:transglutaminase/protease-like cytokinesis protein 3